MGINSFLNEMTTIYMGGNSENDRVASPVTVPIHLKRDQGRKLKMKIVVRLQQRLVFKGYFDIMFDYFVRM